MKTLGQTILAQRRAKKVSVIKLAAELGVTRAAIYQWQRDETAPTLTNLIELSRVLDVPLSVFGASIHGETSIDAELRQLPKQHADILARSFLDQISTMKKLQKS